MVIGTLALTTSVDVWWFVCAKQDTKYGGMVEKKDLCGIFMAVQPIANWLAYQLEGIPNTYKSLSKSFVLNYNYTEYFAIISCTLKLVVVFSVSFKCVTFRSN